MSAGAEARACWFHLDPSSGTVTYTSERRRGDGELKGVGLYNQGVWVSSDGIFILHMQATSPKGYFIGFSLSSKDVETSPPNIFQ